MTGRILLLLLGGSAFYAALKGLTQQFSVVYLVALGFGLVLALIALLPTLLEERWPKEKDLEQRETGDALSKLYPAIKAHGDPSSNDLGDLVRAARDETAERVLLRVNAKDGEVPVLAVLTNRRLLLFRTKRRSLHIVAKIFDELLEKIPGGKILGEMFEAFGEAYEVLFKPKRKEFLETMEQRDEELLEGKTPPRWKKTHDMTHVEIVRLCQQLTIRRAFGLAKTLVVEFTPRNFSKILQTPPQLEIEPRSTAVVANRLVDLFRSEFKWPDSSVVKAGSMLVIKWPA